MTISSLLMATACSNSREAGDAHANLSENDQRSSEISVKIDEIIEVSNLIRSAEDVFVSACMKQEGFTFTGAGLGEAREPIVAFNDLSTWNPEETGYQLVTPEEAEQESAELEEINASFNDLSDEEKQAYSEALYGTEYVDVDAGGMTMSIPTGGCMGAARAEITGSIDAGVQLSALSTGVSGLGLTVRAMVTAEPEFVQAESEWSNCMAAEGYESFASPEEAEEHASQLRTAGSETSDNVEEELAPPSREEILLATADKACRIEADLPGIYRRLFLEAESEVMQGDEAQAMLLEWEEISAPAVEEARRVLLSVGVSTD